MGIFDNNTKQVEYLEEERKKLWDRLLNLEKKTSVLQGQITKKTTDSEKEAFQALKKISEYRNRIEKRLEEGETLIGSINSELDVAKKIKDEIGQTQSSVESRKLSIDNIINSLKESKKEYEDSLEILNEKIEEINKFLENHPDLETELEEIDENLKGIEENKKKSEVSLTAINNRKIEIDDLYRKIFGYTQVNSHNNVETKVEGLKDELEKSYKKLSTDLSNAINKVEEINELYNRKYKDFEGGHSENYKKINDEIRSLLPNALTAGLSSAFSAKKDLEIDNSKSLQKNFQLGIYILIAVSTIPFLISVVFLSQGISLMEVIMKLPRLVLAIIPMYIPVLWFTYSANKKLNLSKRLIEEYSHKEVLSKTFEGLSTQISSINDKSQSEELRIRLLSNFLQVSSENPGKLISNYEASDHPIMEALEQSYKFQIAIDKLGNVPGLSKLAAVLETNTKKKLKEKKEIIDKALSEEGDTPENE